MPAKPPAAKVISLDKRLRFRNARGDVVDVESIPATQLKNELGSVIEKAMKGGAVAITRHDMPRVVLVSYDEFQAMAQARQPNLAALGDEFDRLVQDMQTPRARKGVTDAFDASPAALGKAAVQVASRAPKAVAARAVKKRKARKAG
jgi:antitoxin Phd